MKNYHYDKNNEINSDNIDNNNNTNNNNSKSQLNNNLQNECKPKVKEGLI